MRNVQLRDLVEQFKGRVGQSTLVSAGLDDLRSVQLLLSGTQELLYDEHDWPHMNVERTKQINAGQRYYDMPTDMDYEEINSVSLNTNTRYPPLTRGIGPDEYSGYNTTVNTSPTLKWDIKDTGTGTPQIVLWPTPSSNTDKLFITGRRRLRPLIADSDVCDLDGLLIVLTASVEILYDQKETGKAKRVEALAASRLVRLKSRTKAGSQPVVMRGGTDYGNSRGGPRIIAVK